MVFTTQVFLFIFFPICTVLYLITYRLERITAMSFLRRCRISDMVLILLSLGFYGWACFDNVYKLCLYIAIVYTVTFFIGGWTIVHDETSITFCSKSLWPDWNKRLVYCIVGTVLVLFALFYYKYYNFTIDNLNSLFEVGLKEKSIFAPLGLSFITFSAISYMVDVYMGKAKVGNLVDCVLYITFFPKVASGPIVLWRDFAVNLQSRKVCLDNCLYGVNRIIIGFAKKLYWQICLASIYTR